MDSRRKDEEMFDDVAKPRVRIMETSYVTLPNPSTFKFIVQSLTGAGEEKQPVERKRVSGYMREGEVAGKSGVSQNKRRCGGFDDAGASQLLKEDSFKDELRTMLMPETPHLEEQWKWLFNGDDR